MIQRPTARVGHPSTSGEHAERNPPADPGRSAEPEIARVREVRPRLREHSPRLLSNPHMSTSKRSAGIRASRSQTHATTQAWPPCPLICQSLVSLTTTRRESRGGSESSPRATLTSPALTFLLSPAAVTQSSPPRPFQFAQPAASHRIAREGRPSGRVVLRTANLLTDKYLDVRRVATVDQDGLALVATTKPSVPT